MENAKNVIAEVTAAVTQKSASKKDEITIMKAIMNDSDYKVDVYDKSGTTEYYPARELKKVVTNVVSNVTKIPAKEASELVNTYEFTKADASAMINLSKEFVHSYLQTGRKLPLGGRATSDIELMWKEIGDRTTGIPNKSGERSETHVPAHGGVKASNKCPSWLKQ